jgi:hypothetical protein
LLAQLNDECKKRKGFERAPNIDEIRECKKVAYDSDIAIFLWKPNGNEHQLNGYVDINGNVDESFNFPECDILDVRIVKYREGSKFSAPMQIIETTQKLQEYDRFTISNAKQNAGNYKHSSISDIPQFDKF